MNLQSIYKVPKGKLIKIHLDLDEIHNIMTTISIAGDFFAYPEESISTLENQLIGIRYNKQDIYEVISDFIEQHHVQFIGIDAESLTEAIMRCSS